MLSVPDVLDAFKRAFERRVGGRAVADLPVDLEQQLQAARTRVGNATRLIVEPDDLDLRRQREADRTEVKRLEGELELRVAARPSYRIVQKVAARIASFLRAIAMDAPDRAHQAMARCVSPITVAPKTNGPDRFKVTGAVNLAEVAASGSSGGRI